MVCSCGGLYIVKKIEEIPSNLSKEEKLIYIRLCVMLNVLNVGKCFILNLMTMEVTLT